MSDAPFRPEDPREIAEDVEMAKLRGAMARTREAKEEDRNLREPSWPPRYGLTPGSC